MRGRKRARKKDVRPIAMLYLPGTEPTPFASDVIFQRGRYLISMKTGWRTKISSMSISFRGRYGSVGY